MANTDLVETDVRTILAEAGGNYVAAYDRIVEAEDNQARSTHIVSRSARVERFKDAVATLDRGIMAKANRTFKSYLQLVRKNAPLITGEPHVLTIPESETLMDEALAIKDAQDVLTARWETIKEHVFGHLDEQFAAEGDEAPHLVNGSLDVESRGHRFAREGAGRKEPKLDENALRALLPHEVWTRIVDVQVVRTETVSIPKLMAEAQRDPSILEQLRRSLKVGEDKKARLNVRPL